MNEMEQLNKRIEQLTELVKTGSEAIKSMKAALEAAEEERDRLADQRRESEPKFERMNFEERYYHIREANDGTFRIQGCVDIGCEHSALEFENNNYFHTEQRATEVLEKINLLLRLERLHDTFCPEYVPDWNDKDEVKYYVFKNEFISISRWDIGYVSSSDISDVYFPTEEIAKKVCDILNAEERNNNE